MRTGTDQRSKAVRYILAALLLSPWPAIAQGPWGSEFQVNSYTSNIQRIPSVVSDADGDFVVVWFSYLQDGSSEGVFGQRYASNGALRGSEFQVNSYTTSIQSGASAATDADGDFVVVWASFDQDGSNSGVFGQRYASNGALRGSEFQVNSYTTESQRAPSAASDADGDFVVVWESRYQDDSAYGVFGQRFASNGAPRGSEFQVNSSVVDQQRFPSVATDTDGDFVVAWSSLNQEGSDWGVFGQRYASNGATRGSEFQVNSFTTSHQYGPSVATDTDGDFVVAWTSLDQDGSTWGVFGQRYASDGAPRGSEFQVSSYTTYDQRIPSAATDADGDFVIVWRSLTQDSSGTGIFGQRYTSNGATRGSEFQVNSFTTSYQNGPSVATDANGDFVVAWSSLDQDGSSYGVFGQRYESDEIFADGFESGDTTEW